LKTSDFYYDLPQELIAQHPAERRDGSRLLIYNRRNKSVTDGRFPDVIEHLKAATAGGEPYPCDSPRLIGARVTENGEKGGAMEFLLLKRLDTFRWETLVRPGRRAKTGARFSFGGGELTAVVESSTEDGGRVVRFEFKGIWEEVLDRVGKVPLPPYITEELKDPERYQTVYSKEEGSAAAPTAGLHFTPELLERAKAKGVTIVEILLTWESEPFDRLKRRTSPSTICIRSTMRSDAKMRTRSTPAAPRGEGSSASETTSCRTLENRCGRGRDHP
jgi:S-adenosylmethionine:tRNA ribosyltransferase-isomerase